MNRLIYFLIIFAIALAPFSALAVEPPEAHAISVGDYVRERVTDPSAAAVGGEWAVIGLARLGGVPCEYFDSYYTNLCRTLRSKNGILHTRKYTEYARAVIALSATGLNPADICGHNLILPLTDVEKVLRQGHNGAVWALIALNSITCDITKEVSAAISDTREKYITEILNNQQSGGGWALSENSLPEPDITAMSVTALSPYINRSDVSASVNTALRYLSAVQTDSGCYKSGGIETSESCAQVLTALCALKINTTDNRFVKNGKTVLDALLSFRLPNGGFLHTHADTSESLMSSEQALCALTAHSRFISGKPSLYDMSDAVKAISDKLQASSPDKLAILYPGKTFSDISEAVGREGVEALASRGIINGKSADLFDPYGNMTRAELTAVVARTLKLEENGYTAFADVPTTAWYYPYINAASGAGIITGVSDTVFNPNGNISREEAAVIIMRAARVLDITTSYDDAAIRNTLSAFTDYTKASLWAREALAFCYDRNFLPADDIEIRPKASALRSEISDMLYQLLLAAGLI